MKRICVFAGSNSGIHPKYSLLAQQLGEEIAKNNIELVYGGSKYGLMGEVANKVLACGGTVIGIMPTGLIQKEFAHTELTQFIEVKDMHERKALMGNLSDAYVALPGGYGTFEELFEVISWAQLGIHHKPIGLLNIEGYYLPLLELVDHAIRSGFVQEKQKNLLISASKAKEMIEKLKQYQSSLHDSSSVSSEKTVLD